MSIFDTPIQENEIETLNVAIRLRLFSYKSIKKRYFDVLRRRRRRQRLAAPKISFFFAAGTSAAVPTPRLRLPTLVQVCP